MSVFLTTVAADEGIYLSGGGGANFSLHAQIISEDDQRASFIFDPGYGLFASIGYGYGAYRVEYEALMTRNEVNRIEFGGRKADAAGYMKSFSQFVNFYYDRPLSDALTFSAGIGIGMSRILMFKIRNQETDTMIVDGSDGARAYQVKAGLAYRVREHLQLTFDGRYLGNGELAYRDRASDQDFKIQTIRRLGLEIGLRYFFAMEE